LKSSEVTGHIENYSKFRYIINNEQAGEKPVIKVPDMPVTTQLDIFSSSPDELNWKTLLKDEKEKDYFRDILSFIEKERAAGKVIYPRNSDIFNAIAYTPFSELKVVIIGQDPYHGPGQAHGLCFSVKPGTAFPPSLINIFRELQNDLGMETPLSGCLEKWARQGVLLLNAILTVEEGKPQSHSKLGWERFTDRIIEEINNRKNGVVFLLWGAFAQKKGEIIDKKRHYVLHAPHPSPLSANRGFFGCKHFSKCNEILKGQGERPIDWTL